MSEVKVLERLQAGGNFLFRFNCPTCENEQLVGYPIGKLGCCGADLSGAELVIKHARLLCGTKRPGRISKSTIRRLLHINGPHCAYCQTNVEDTFHVEHIVPISAGGGSAISNLCLACSKCNTIAGSKVFCSFDGKRLYILERRSQKES